MKQSLTNEEKEKRETWLSEISAKMMSLMRDFDTTWKKDHFPWNEDLANVFHGKTDEMSDYSRALHDYFGVEPVFLEVEPVFPMFENEDLHSFSTLDELYSYMAYLVLEKHNLLGEDEKLR